MRKFSWLALVAISGCSSVMGSSSPAPRAASTQPAAQEGAAEAPVGDGFDEANRVLAKLAPVYMSKAGKPPPTLLRAYVVNSDWGMVRTDLGVITSRSTRATVIYKGGETGRCYQTYCNVKQEEQGGRWGNPYMECLAELTQPVTCGSVDTLRPSS